MQQDSEHFLFIYFIYYYLFIYDLLEVKFFSKNIYLITVSSI